MPALPSASQYSVIEAKDRKGPFSAGPFDRLSRQSFLMSAINRVVATSTGLTRVLPRIAMIGLLACAFQSGALADEHPKSTTQSSTAAPEADAISKLIHQLGDSDPKIRDEARKSLWTLGRAAEPALREAASGDDPEVSRRAKAILRDFTYGLYPDAPHEIFAFLESYRKGDQADKRVAVGGLSSLGVPGLRVLLKLREEERDPVMKQIIAQVLGPREHEVAVLMLADGQVGTVEQILESAAIDSPVAAQDYAALLLCSAKLPDKFARLKAAPPAVRSSRLLLAMARAAGDLPTARAAAELSGNPQLVEAILIEQRDWKMLASRLALRQGDMRAPDWLGYLCTYYRLAGDTASYRQTLKKLETHAAQHPEDHAACANGLFLNDAPDAATAILLKQDDYLLATNFLAPRLQLREAVDLPRRAAEHQPGEVTQVKARTVGTLEFIGESQKARKLMTEVTEENRLRNDFATWVYLIDSAREMGLRREMDQFAAAALEKATRQDPVLWLFERMRLGDPSSATLWWQFLKQQFADETTANRLARLRSIFDQTISKEDLEKLSELARRYAVDLPVAEREQWQATVADTLVAAGQMDLAGKWIEQLEQAPSAASLIHAGDFRAERKDWATAAGDYDNAWERDRTNAAALFLHGWALKQSGKHPEGEAMMELAHRLPLGNETERLALMETLTRHKLDDDAHREMELILHATAPRSWERNEAMRRAAEQLAGKGDNLAAADLWQQAFLQNLSSNVSFAEPWANVLVPALIHKTHAMGLIQSGQIEKAIEEADLMLEETPGDADALIDLVNALEKSGNKSQADALYVRHTALYRKMIGDYPNSGPLHNQLAWTQVMCHRELDDALNNGKRAVELEPASTASMDTLAEVYFARGDPAAAAAQMKRCVEIEPRVERHRKQLARFEAAQSEHPH
jgi:tetratricopeptide (TPR) repeat protein